jgi:hypothetical protein
MALEWTMLSMVSVNRFINAVVIPLVIVAYAVFLLIDYRDHTEVAPHRDRIQSIQKIGNIHGLLFGGSNAVYSLSAELLSYDMGINWYNASVVEELRTIQRYQNFIQDLVARIDRTTVRYVVYSSIAPYQMGAIAKSEYSENLGIKPKISALGYIRHQPFAESKFPQRDDRNRFGDMVFGSVNCHFKSVVKHERENEDISTEFLVDYAIFFASLFPNASILIVLPSEYYGALSFDDSIFEQSLRAKFYSVLKTKYSKKNAIKIIFQPPYSGITQVCDQQNHANKDGRLWRTRNLIGFMREAVVR